MARKTKPDITMQQAMDAHLDYIRATFSVNTLNDYRVTHRLFLEFLAGEEVLFREADEELVQEFLTTMRETPISRQRGAAAVANPTMGYRKPKTVQNMRTALCSLWRWGVDRGYVAENIMGDVRRPKVASVPIVPLGNGELVKLFRACVESRAYHNKPLSTNYRPTAERDRAIVALLTETMLRVSELSDLRQRDVKISNGGGQVWVEMGKGGKSRRVPFGRECAKILRDYLVVGKGAADEPFIQDWTKRGQGMGAKALTTLVRRLGARVGVDAHPHKLRTTGACMAIKNGMNPRTLQILMGHADIATTMRYVRAAEVDLDAAMMESSPLDNLRG